MLARNGTEGEKFLRGVMTSSVPTSTIQFLSSSGDCKMIGDANYKRKLFFVKNFDSIRLDIARGEGEHISSYISLMNCSIGEQKNTKLLLQSKFINIFGSDLSNSTEDAYLRIYKTIKSNEALAGKCKIEAQGGSFPPSDTTRLTDSGEAASDNVPGRIQHTSTTFFLN